MTKEQIKEAKNDEEKAVPEMLTVWIELYGYAKDDFKAIPDGKSFFTCLMTKAPVKKMMLDEIPKTTIIKEEIAENGESGHILFNEDGKENKMKFVKEGGEWKLAIDMNKQSPN